MPLEHAVITNTVTGDRIPVMFNPEEYTVSRENNFAQMAIPGLAGPLLQFVHGNMQTLDMELLVDTLESHTDGARLLNQAGDDVRKVVGLVTGLLDIDPTTHAPPVLLFTWASLSFSCVLARANQRFIMFAADGTPVRAKLTLTFNEFTNADLEPKEIKRETANFTQRYQVTDGQTLSGIAAAVYNNPSVWRALAVANDIDDPRALTAGTWLVVPRLPYRNPETGTVYQ